jgi:hypothetical protein
VKEENLSYKEKNVLILKKIIFIIMSTVNYTVTKKAGCYD